jgi:hypothetical protein
MNKIENPIIEKYINVINEYFDSINSYVNVNLIENQHCFLSSGLNIIKNIFEYTFVKKKNLVIVELYGQRSFFYYLEYIKQLQEAEMHFDIDYLKTSIFVYEKILSEINNEEINSISNILSLTRNNESEIEFDLKDTINQINIFIQNLLNKKNNCNFENFKKIYKNNEGCIRKYYKNLSFINKYINLLKEKLDINQEDNTKLINNTCLMLTNSKKKINEDLNLIKKFYINDEVLREKYKTLTTKDFVYWLVFHNSR